MLVYLVWALLPGLYFFLITQELLRRLFKYHGKEDLREYVRLFLLCAFGLALAIISDIYFFPETTSVGSIGEQGLMVISWLQYPAFMLIMFQLSALKERLNKKSSRK